VVLNFSFAENYIEFGRPNVAELPHIIGATRIFLQIIGLLEQVLNVRTKRLAGVEVEFWTFRGKMSTDLFKSTKPELLSS